MKYEDNRDRLFDFLFSSISLDGFYQFICACIVSGHNEKAKQLIDLGYIFVDLMTYYDKEQW